jgi:ABC-2 type transport system ATP-binding protein
MSEMALTADHLIVIGRGQLLADMSIQDFIAANSAGFARVRTPDTEPQLREKLSAAITEAGGHVLPEQDGALRVTGLALPRISGIAHEADVRLWELSPHQASLEEAYMRMTQGAVDYRSTIDQKEGLMQPLPPGAQPPMPVPGQGQPGWYAPPPPQQGGQPFAPVQGHPPANPYGGPGAATPNPYAQPGPTASQGPTAPQAPTASQGPAHPAPGQAPGAPQPPAHSAPAQPAPGAAVAPAPQQAPPVAAPAQAAAPAPQGSAPQGSAPQQSATPTEPKDAR